MSMGHQERQDSSAHSVVCTTGKNLSKTLIVVVAGLFLPAEAAGSPGKGALACSFQTPGGDLRVFTCPFEGTGTTQAYRFSARFSGGHDDTSASMSLTLNGSPQLCETGSKTHLFGEDGDVSLECRVQIKEKDGTKLVLGVTLLWSHAQYVGTELVPD